MSRLNREEEPEIPESLSKELEEYAEEENYNRIPIDVTRFVSTGCTLLDLNIMGGRIRGGGLPGGIMVEISGGSGSGKTGLLMDTVASVQSKGGEARVCDPESRLDKEYANICGAKIPDAIYFRPNIVLDHKNDRGKVIEQGIEGLFNDWEPKNTDVINIFAADSIAALSTAMEMASGDKMGMRKAKELSEFCRKMARKIASDHKLVIFTNQLRDGSPTPTGMATKVTTGGHAVPFYSSLRITSTQIKKILRKKKNEHSVEIGKDVGIISELKIIKNSIDDPYRKCNMYLLFGYGISDVMGNLQYIKEITNASKFDVLDRTYVSIWDAVPYIEENNLEEELRDWVIEEWEKNESLFQTKHKPKKRF